MVKVVRWLSGISIAFVVAVIICLLVLGHYFSELPKHRVSLESSLTSHLEASVKLADLSTYWQGFKPIIDIQNLDIRDRNNPQQTLLHIGHLRFSINLLASLWAWKIQPGDLFVDNTHIKLKEAHNGLVYINDIPTLTADIHNPNSEKLKMLGEWFLGKGKKRLTNVRITWYGLNGNTIPINQVELRGHGSTWNHHYTVNARLDNDAVLQIHGNVFGSIFLEQLLYTNLNFVARNLPIHTLLAGLDKPVRFVNGAANIDGKLTWLPHGKINFFGLLNARDVVLQKENQIDAIKTLTTQFSLDRFQKGWGVSVSNLQLNLNNNNLPIHQGSFKYFTGQKARQIFQFDFLPIAEVLKTAHEQNLLSQTFVDAVAQLKPSGDIHHLTVSHQGSSFDFSKFNDFAISATLKKVSINAWKKIPGLKNISGQLELQPQHGRLALKSDNVAFEYSPLFRWSIPIEKINAYVTWKKINDRWLMNVTKQSYIKTKDAYVSGGMTLSMPENGSSPHIQTKMQFEIFDAKNASVYYPAGIMSQKLLAWLDAAIKGGRFTKGNFVLDGRLKDFPFDHNNGKFLVSAQINNGNLHYFHDLPDAEQIQGSLVFKNRSMFITANKASVLGVQAYSSVAQIKDLAHSVLNLKVNLAAHALQTIKLDAAMIKLVSSSLVTDLFLHGKMNIAFALWLPLDKKNNEHFKLSGHANLQNVDINLANNNFDFKEVTGNVLVNENAVNAQQITGKLFNNPFNLNIQTLPQNGIFHTLINWQGILDSTQLQQRFQNEWIKRINGKTHFSGWIDTYTQDKNLTTTMELKSDLSGLAIDLPLPFTKATDTQQPTIVKSVYAKNLLGINFSSGPLLGYLAYHTSLNDLQFNHGVISLGGNLPASPAQGLLITGHLPKIDWRLWHDLVTPKDQQQKAMPLPFPAQVNISIDKFLSDNIDINQLNLQATANARDWFLEINSSMLDGKITVPFDFPNHPLQAQLQRLEWKGSKNDQALTPSDIPPMEVEINNLRYKDKDIKNVKFKVQPKDHDLVIQELKITDPLFQMQGSGDWQNRNQQQMTHLQGQLNINNMGALLNHWKLTDNVVLGHGTINFNLAWADAINSPEMKSMEGNVNLQFKKGRIIHLSQQAQVGIGVGRVLNLLSLQTIPRRLLLDFSDLTSNGFNFDKMGGSFELDKGNAFTRDAFLEGTEAKVRVNGKIGLAEKDYNLTLKIFPNVTSSLPLVATIAAGPIAGVATWLADKIFSHQVKKITEIHYNVTGSWKQPNMIKLSDNRVNHE